MTVLDEPAERALVVKLSAFGDVLREVEVTLEPHRLCNYLYELAGAYTAFYDACPVLKAEGRGAQLAAGAVRADRRVAEDRPRAARHHRPLAHVVRSSLV